jgi:hypothetical protein
VLPSKAGGRAEDDPQAQVQVRQVVVVVHKVGSTDEVDVCALRTLCT